MKLRVIIAGTRSFNDYELLKRTCDRLLTGATEIIIVSGKAPGADKLGEGYARERGYDVDPYPAAWDDITVPGAVIKKNRFGKLYNAKAGHDRNEKMARNADLLICFWDGKSTGTADMMERAIAHNLSMHCEQY